MRLTHFQHGVASLAQGHIFDDGRMEWTFTGEVIEWRGPAPYLFVAMTPEESEDRLYHAVSDYLQRDNLQALPASQRTLITLVLRKLLASSTFAIAGALNSMSARLKAKLKKAEPPVPLEEELDQDYEALDETAEEWEEDEPEPPLSGADRAASRVPNPMRQGSSIVVPALPQRW